MSKIIFAIGILALGAAFSSAARADYAVVMFQDGTCRVWNESAAQPWHPGWKYHWVGLKSWEFAGTKKHYALAHHWCKSFVQW
jgi:hypothetical protein